MGWTVEDYERAYGPGKRPTVCAECGSDEVDGFTTVDGRDLCDACLEFVCEACGETVCEAAHNCE